MCWVVKGDGQPWYYHEHTKADMNESPSTSISTSAIIKTILLLLLVWALFYLRELVLIMLTSIVIASAIEPGVGRFMRYRIPRVFSVLSVYLISGAVFAGLFYAFAPILLEEFSTLLVQLPEHLGSLDIPGTSLSSQTIIEELSVSEILRGLQASLSSTSAGLLQTASAIFGGLLSFILVIVFSFYFAVQETGADDFLRIVTPLKYQERILNLWKRSQIKIGRWMQGQLALALIIGILVYLGLTILSVPYALLLAILAAVFELVPVFGPVLAAIPATAIALTSGGVTLMLLTIGYFVIIQQFENHLLYPMVVTKVVGVPPLLIILALLIGAKLAGILGIILSVPAAVIVQELVFEIGEERKKPVSRM